MIIKQWWKITTYTGCHHQYKWIPSSMNTSSPLSFHKKKIKFTEERKSNLKRKLNPSFWPLARLWTTLYVALQGVFIGAEGRRVPDEVAHESWSMMSSTLPQKLGFCRGIAAFLGNLATRFGAWLLLVRPSGRLLLEV